MTPLSEHPCSKCGRVAQRIKRLPEGGGLCRQCYNDGRKEPCSRCGRSRTPTRRTPEGLPLCSHCGRSERECSTCGRVAQVARVIDGNPLCRRCYQAPVKTCGGCGEFREVAARAQGGVSDLCRRCYRTPDMECGVCRLIRAVHTTWPLGAVCTTCYRSVLRNPRPCYRCGHVRALIGRSDTGTQICGSCAGSPRDYLCLKCGTPGEQHFTNLCKRCSIVVAVEQILASASGTIPEGLAGLPAALATYGRPDSTMRWLDRPIPKGLLASLASGQAITHSSLDRCPPGHAREHLRSLLVAAQILPRRDENADRLATWTDDFLADLPRHHAALIKPYAHWMVLRLVRRRARRRRTSVGVATSARERVRSAARLLRHLDHRQEMITDLSQATLDDWLGGNRTRTSNTSPFIKWLNNRGITDELFIATPKRTKPTRVNPDEQQQAQIHELLTSHDQEVEPPERVAGLLVLLYGARLERIHRLTTADLTRQDGRLHLALSDHPTELPTELACLIEQLAADVVTKPRARTYTDDADYLFPSTRRPHAPMHPGTLGRRLARIGVRPQITRNTAMVALASDLPAAIISTQLGLTPESATRWARHARRDSIEYLVARVAVPRPQDARAEPSDPLRRPSASLEET